MSRSSSTASTASTASVAIINVISLRLDFAFDKFLKFPQTTARNKVYKFCDKYKQRTLKDAKSVKSEIE